MKEEVIIFLTDLPFWSMNKGSGAPSFYKTVDLYKSKGHKIYFITTNNNERSGGYFSEDELFIIDKNRYMPFLKIPKISYIANEIRHFNFGMEARNIVKNIVKVEKNKKIILYAYEIFGVKAAQRLSRELDCPFITRFQGTFLCEQKHTIADKIRFHLHYDALKVVSDMMVMTDDGTLGKKIVREIGNHMEPIFFWRNGVDLVDKDLSFISDFDKEKLRCKWKIEKSDTVLLTVSRLVEWKRIDRSLTAISQMKQSGKNIKLLIVGEGSARAQLEKLSVDLGLQERVIFAGMIPQEEVYQYMMIADIFISLYDLSNLGNPMFEALVMGKCIVTLNNGGTGSVIKDKYNARMMMMQDTDKIPQILDELVLDSEERIRLGKNARDYAMKNFYTWKKRMEMEYMAFQALVEE